MYIENYWNSSSQEKLANFDQTWLTTFNLLVKEKELL